MVSKEGRRCHQCPGLPPLLQCKHTKAGHQFLEQRAHEIRSETRQADLDGSLGQEKGPNSVAPQLNPPAMHLPNQLSIQYILERTMPQSPAQNVGPATPSRNRQPSSHSPTTPSTPFGNGVPGQQTDSGPATPMSSPLFGRSGDSLLPPSSPLHPGSSSTVPGLIRKKAKVTKQNPAWGHVTGAMRGSKKLEIIRPQPLRKRMEDHASSTKRFHREIAALIGRAERLAEETGCWLALMAQHGNSGSSATHFTSSSLRRDAKEDTVSLINDFHSITRALLISKRQGALDMAKKLVEAEESAVSAQTALALKEAQLAEARALLAQYGISVPSNSD